MQTCSYGANNVNVCIFAPGLLERMKAAKSERLCSTGCKRMSNLKSLAMSATEGISISVQSTLQFIHLDMKSIYDRMHVVACILISGTAL